MHERKSAGWLVTLLERPPLGIRPAGLGGAQGGASWGVQASRQQCALACTTTRGQQLHTPAPRTRPHSQHLPTPLRASRAHARPCARLRASCGSPVRTSAQARAMKRLDEYWQMLPRVSARACVSAGDGLAARANTSIMM